MRVEYSKPESTPNQATQQERFASRPLAKSLRIVELSGKAKGSASARELFQCCKRHSIPLVLNYDVSSRSVRRDRTLAAMGYLESSNHDGFRYQRSWQWAKASSMHTLIANQIGIVGRDRLPQADDPPVVQVELLAPNKESLTVFQ